VTVCRECKLEGHFFSRQVLTVIKIRTVQSMWTNEDVKIIACLHVSLYLTFCMMLGHHLGSSNIHTHTTVPSGGQSGQSMALTSQPQV
jgi:hypothetical protein